MKTHTHTHTTTTYTIPGTEIEVELPFEPSPIMHYREPLVRITDDKIILGYLADDSDCENPLESDEGMGHIYEARRHGNTLSDYCDALGLRHDGGGPDLDLVPEEDVVAEAHRRLLADQGHEGLAVKARDYCLANGWDLVEGEGDLKYITRCLDSINELTPVIDIPTIQLDLWREGRKNGTIGSKYAVMLDVYEHGGISYSVSGEGMQCQFDTAKNGAVWVPNDCCLDEIKRRGAVYRKGRIYPGQRSDSWAVLHSPLNNVRSSAPFDSWGQAFEYLQALDVEPMHTQDEAEHIAARELAGQAAETYTDWCNGNCFITVVATYDKDGTETDYDTICGFVGADYAYEALVNDYFPKED